MREEAHITQNIFTASVIHRNRALVHLLTFAALTAQKNENIRLSRLSRLPFRDTMNLLPSHLNA
jgi:hypothetical protein